MKREYGGTHLRFLESEESMSNIASPRLQPSGLAARAAESYVQRESKEGL